MTDITANYLNWGKLIKTWATGKSYFESDTPSIGIEQLPIPHSIEELRAQMVLVGAEALLPPPNVVGLAIVQYTPDTMGRSARFGWTNTRRRSSISTFAKWHAATASSPTPF